MATLIVLPGQALAWSQATTSSGLPLYQKEQCHHVTLSTTGADDIPDPEELHRAVWMGLEVWNAPACSDMRFLDAGVSRCTVPDVADRGTQATLIVFYENEWPFESPLGNPFAATGLWYDTETGEILDADIALNGFDYTWSTVSAPGSVDVASIVAHEAGHVLGLGESEVAEATMFGFATVGETTKRDLAEDDVQGLCTLYPAGAEPEPCPPAPGPQALCESPEACGCIMVGTRSGATGAIAVIATLFLALFVTSWSQGSRSRRLQRGHGYAAGHGKGTGGIGIGECPMPTARDVRQRGWSR